jgi:hypothetical protein
MEAAIELLKRRDKGYYAKLCTGEGSSVAVKFDVNADLVWCPS